MPLPATLAVTSSTVITPAVTPKFHLYPQLNHHPPSTLHFFTNNNNNNPTTTKQPLTMKTTTTTTTTLCSSSSSSYSSSTFSSTFPSNIRIPDVKYYPNENQDFNLHTSFIRMLIRDDESKLMEKLLNHECVYIEWFEKKDTFFNLFNDMTTVSHTAATGIAASLLEHRDAWVAGYSFVLHEICDLKFLLELFKLESVFNQYAKEASENANTVKSVELILMIVSTGTITDVNVQSTEDLVDFLKSLKYNKGNTKFVVPIFYPSSLSKEKLDKIKGYAHLCLGKFP